MKRNVTQTEANELIELLDEMIKARCQYEISARNCHGDYWPSEDEIQAAQNSMYQFLTGEVR